jgi:hypothetical protein
VKWEEEEAGEAASIFNLTCEEALHLYQFWIL